jgi:hypothetical protein
VASGTAHGSQYPTRLSWPCHLLEQVRDSGQGGSFLGQVSIVGTILFLVPHYTSRRMTSLCGMELVPAQTGGLVCLLFGLGTVGSAVPIPVTVVFYVGMQDIPNGPPVEPPLLVIPVKCVWCGYICPARCPSKWVFSILFGYPNLLSPLRRR